MLPNPKKTPLILLLIKHTWPLITSVNTTFLSSLPCHPQNQWLPLFSWLILSIFFRSLIPAWPIGIFKFSSCNLIFIFINISFLNNLTQFQDFEYCICNTNAKFISHASKSKLMYIIVHSVYPSIFLIGISIVQDYSGASLTGMHKDRL